MKSDKRHLQAAPIAVSLFTREWIEIGFRRRLGGFEYVSLFTREWIEIRCFAGQSPDKSSPSLRGSGLKSVGELNSSVNACLPLYEGVD